MKIIKYILTAIILLQSIAYANEAEDELIVKAIYYSQKEPELAATYWKKLFELTNDEDYLIEYFYASLAYKDIKDVIKELKEVLSKKKNKELYELLGSLYTREGNTDGVIEVIEKLSDNNIESLYELAYLYTLKGNEEKALKIYKKIYNIEHSWKSLKGMLSILVRQNRRQEAAKILWEALKKYKMPKEAYIVMAGLINIKQDYKKAIYVFNKLYEMTKDKEYLKQLISLYLYKRDYDSLIPILEKTHFDDNLLFELYIAKHQKVKAYKLLDKLYKQSKNPKWLAQKAILTYEIANDYKAVDDNVLNYMAKLFKEAFKQGLDEPMYYNYYGYTLIDYNKDINEGIKYVKKALLKKPNNSFYLDSLAWGYYKLKKCKEAKEIMDKIKKLGPIKEDEIIKHDKMIQECKEK